MIKKHVWPQSTKLWPFMRVGLAIVLMKYLPILPTCLYQSLRKFNQIFINQSANSSCLHLTSLNKVQQTAIFEWFGREVALVLCSDGSTHRPHRSWPRASRNSFPWRLITNLKFGQLRRGITHNLLWNERKCKRQDSYQCCNNMIIFFVTQYQNDNTAFHRSSSMSGGLASKSDVKAVLNSKKINDNLACRKARNKLVYRLWDVGYVGVKHLVPVDANNHIFAIFFMDTIACACEGWLW